MDSHSALCHLILCLHLSPEAKVNSESFVKEDEPKRTLEICVSAFLGAWCLSFTILALLFAAGLVTTFRVFGSLSVEWPGKDGKHPRCPPKGNMPKGNKDMVGAFFSP